MPDIVTTSSIFDWSADSPSAPSQASPVNDIGNIAVYKRVHPRSQHEQMAWLTAPLNPQVASVAQQVPAFYGSANYTTPNIQKYKTQFYRHESRWFGRPFDPALFEGSFQSLGNSYVTPKAKPGDRFTGLWGQDTSFVANLPQPVLNIVIAPQISQQSQSFMTLPSKKLDVRLYPWDATTSWSNVVALLNIPKYQAAFSQQVGSFRTLQMYRGDVRLGTWNNGDGGWIQFIVTHPQAQPTHLIVRSDYGCTTMYLGV